MIEVLLPQCVSTFIMQQIAGNMQSSPTTSSSSCPAFKYINNILNAIGSTPSTKNFEPLTENEFDVFHIKFFASNKIMNEFINDKQLCLNCRQRLNSNKELRSTISNLNKIKYGPYKLGTQLIGMLSGLTHDAINLARQLHNDNKGYGCNDEIKSILDIPYNQRSFIIQQFLPKKIQQLQNDKLLKEGLKLIIESELVKRQQHES